MPERGGFRLDERLYRLYNDLLQARSNRQGDVGAHHLVHIQFETSFHCRLETFVGHGHGIVSWLQLGDGVTAVAVGFHHSRDVRLSLRHRDVRVRHQSSGTIAHGPDDFAGLDLSFDRNADGQRESKNDRHRNI